MSALDPKVLDKLKLWFFRDLQDSQRRALFQLFGMPVDEIKTHGTQTMAFKHIFATPLKGQAEAVAWRKKRKGTATVYTHPSLDRAVVQSPYAVTYNGEIFATVEAAKRSALASPPGEQP